MVLRILGSIYIVVLCVMTQFSFSDFINTLQTYIASLIYFNNAGDHNPTMIILGTGMFICYEDGSGWN
jgi:hypothetical protein